MKTMKRIAAILLAVITVLSLTSCGLLGGGDDKDYSLYAGKYECDKFYISSTTGKTEKNYGSDGEYLQLDEDGTGKFLFWDLEAGADDIDWDFEEKTDADGNVTSVTITVYYKGSSDPEDTMTLEGGVLTFTYANDDGSNVRVTFKKK